MGMIGGGPDSFTGTIHRITAKSTGKLNCCVVF